MSNYRKPKTHNINDIITWNNNNELDYSPKYQRNPVWNIKAKSYLIDSILRGLPIPPIFIKENIDINLNKTMREIVDGQQRIRTILEFKNDAFKILKEHNEDFKNCNYSDLPDDKKRDFLSFEISFEIITTNQEPIIYDMFARLNTNNKVLNAQELRNAKYWGFFKVLCYKLAKETKQFFIDLNTFTDAQFARMIDVEFISSLLILCIDGIISETPKIINNYYHKYDEEFPDMNSYEKKFKNMIDEFSKIFNFNECGYNTEYFHRKVYFYTIFAVLFHSKYGLRNFNEKKYPSLNNEKRMLKFIEDIKSFELKLNDVQQIGEKKREDIKLNKFLKLHVSRTTNYKERKERIIILNDYLINALF